MEPGKQEPRTFFTLGIRNSKEGNMPASGQLDNIEDLLDKSEVPQRVTTRAVFRALQAIWIKLNGEADNQASLIELMGDLEHRVKFLEDDRIENPSIIAYVKEKPVRAVGLLIGFMFLLTIAFSMSEPLRTWVSALIP